MKTHAMKLRDEPFELIKNGSKTIEVRLFDEKRRKVGVGDTVIFSRMSGTETVTTKVTALYVKPSFESLYNSFPIESFGGGIGDTAKTLTENIYRYYTKEQERTFGVLGIEIILN